MENTFVSRFQIDEEVQFIDDDPLIRRDGRVIAIRFTRSKVFYDILDENAGVLFTNLVSDKVRPPFPASKLFED